MRNPFRKKLSSDQIKAIVDKVCDDKNPLSSEDKLKLISPLRESLTRNETTVSSLIYIIRHGELSENENLEIAREIINAYPDHEEAILEVASVAENLRNIDYLNDPHLDEAFGEKIINRLIDLWENYKDEPEEKEIVEHLSTFAKHAGRKHDAIAEKAYKRTIDLYPNKSWPQYNWGLFCKTRGRFKAGMIANQKAIQLSVEPGEGTLWNLGICAMGQGDLETALKIWKDFGNNIEPGRFGLPEGKYASVKVRLAEFPLAERSANNDFPGMEETIWIERLSPCHGIVDSVLYEDLGVDYGDVILFDGAPITYHKVGDREVPIFPHLTTLKKRNYQFYDFVGLQKEPRQLLDLSAKLSGDTIIYPHSDLYRILCWECYNNPASDHSKHATSNDIPDISVVSGRIAASPDISPSDLLSEIDNVLGGNPALRIFSPALCVAAGQDDRAVIEQKRFDELFE